MTSTTASHITVENKQRLHVLHCIFSMNVGGAETMLVDIINNQVSRGQTVTLIIVNDFFSPELIAKLNPDARVIMMGRRPGSNPFCLLWRLNRIINKLKPDIIHLHNHKLCPLIRIRRNRILLTVHDINIPMRYTRRIHMAAITDAVENDIHQRLPDADVTTILNGIQIADIQTRLPHPPGKTFKIVQVARLTAQKKGQDILIKALSILDKKGLKDIEVTFIGDGPDLESLTNLAENLGVISKVHFDGLRDRNHIYSTLKDYDAMCHPSRWEGFGLTIAEAMAAGLPIIVTKGDGPWEIADHGKLCLSISLGSAEECADAIERIIKDYPSTLAKAAEAKEYVNCYDISHTVENYLNLYHRIINE